MLNDLSNILAHLFDSWPGSIKIIFRGTPKTWKGFSFFKFSVDMYVCRLQSALFDLLDLGHFFLRLCVWLSVCSTNQTVWSSNYLSLCQWHMHERYLGQSLGKYVLVQAWRGLMPPMFCAGSVLLQLSFVCGKIYKNKKILKNNINGSDKISLKEINTDLAQTWNSFCWDNHCLLSTPKSNLFIHIHLSFNNHQF